MRFVSIRARTYRMEVQVIWLIVFNLRLMVFAKHMRNFWISTVPWYTFTYHLEELTGNLWHVHGSDSLLWIEPSGRKGSVTYGLGADSSLPPCLATGIWALVPKAIFGPKSRGASFGTTLWRHVQRYCSHFLLFLQVSGSGTLFFCAGASFLKLIYSTLLKDWRMTIPPSFQKCVVYLLLFFRFLSCINEMILEFIN